MSWETFVVGRLELRPGLSEERATTILDDFREVLETELEWDQDHEYRFEDTNWSSHVSGDRIRECYQKHKRSIMYILLSLWYSSEPDYSLYVDGGPKELAFGKWPPLTSKKIMPVLEYLFGTMLPLEASL